MTKCYLCEKDIEIGEEMAEIIITKNAKTWLGAVVNSFFKFKTDRFSCLDCLKKGLTYRKELKIND